MTTTPTTPATTEARGLATFSVRTRITAAVALLVALALTGAGILVYVLGSASVDDRVQEAIDQEMAEFATFQESADPPYASSRALIRAFLLSNIGTSSELLVGYWNGGVRQASASERARLAETPELERAVADLAQSGGVRTLDTQWGRVRLDVQPISDGGAFAVAYFLQDEYDVLHRMTRTYAVAAVLALALVTALAAWQAGRLLRPVRTLRETAEEIEGTDLSRRIPESGNDDLTDLTRTFNAMLERLENAFHGQRAFLDDAGHELRTPLTIVRGHLELLDRADPEDVERTRELVLDEVDRMSRLVGDLILLTKADAPDFFGFDPVDTGALLERVLDKCRALGDRDWQIDARTDVSAVLDEQRITQALLQLAENAVKHTRPGDTVALGTEVDVAERALRLWVRDTGPGVAEEHKQVIFDRFGRGVVAEDDHGFGLGLSIVAAIAAGHGGGVQVFDTEPQGAKFVIQIPLRRSARWPAS